MKLSFRRSSLVWLAVAVAALGCLNWANRQRIGRIERVSTLVAGAKSDDTSLTGYTHGTRNLLILERNQASQPWIIETQQMAATGQWRLQRADYDNAPEGRAVSGTTPYRIWLRLITAAEQMFGGHSAGRAVERAALHADPALHLLLCLSVGLLVAGKFGADAASLLVIGLAVLFPLTGTFLPGQPDEHGLTLASALLGLLALAVGLQSVGSGRASLLWFIAAGASGGFGLWVEAGSLLPLLGGLLPGGIAAALLTRRQESTTPAATRWGGWIAGGVVVGVSGWLAVGSGGLPAPGPNIFALAGHTAADNVTGWITREGLSLPLIAACLPLLIIPAAIWLVCHPEPTHSAKRILLVALGPATVLALLACFQLGWWSLLDAALLGLLVAVVAALPAVTGGTMKLTWWRVVLAALLLPGAALLWPQANRKAGEDVLTAPEARAMIERDLALWLANRSPHATVYAPPNLSASLAYYGGLRVIGSPYPGNKEGLALAVRIAGAASVDEVHALVQQREIQYIILPSWDTVLDEFARLGSATPEKSLITQLRQWLPPRWLRPVPYPLPQIEGLEGEAVFLFEVVEPQDNATALSRLAEYFVEMNQPGLAAAVSEALAKSFAGDPGALIARAQVALARTDGPGLSAAMAALLPAIADGKDEDLTWERRANLALVLAQVKRPDLAKGQVRFCLGEADADRLRSLTTVSLYRLLVLSRAYGFSFTDQKLHGVALDLLPDELRLRLQK